MGRHRPSLLKRIHGTENKFLKIGMIGATAAIAIPTIGMILFPEVVLPVLGGAMLSGGSSVAAALGFAAGETALAAEGASGVVAAVAATEGVSGAGASLVAEEGAETVIGGVTKNQIRSRAAGFLGTEAVVKETSNQIYDTVKIHPKDMISDQTKLMQDQAQMYKDQAQMEALKYEKESTEKLLQEEHELLLQKQQGSDKQQIPSSTNHYLPGVPTPTPYISTNPYSAPTTTSNETLNYTSNSNRD